MKATSFLMVIAVVVTSAVNAQIDSDVDISRNEEILDKNEIVNKINEEIIKPLSQVKTKEETLMPNKTTGNIIEPKTTPKSVEVTQQNKNPTTAKPCKTQEVTPESSESEVNFFSELEKKVTNLLELIFGDDSNSTSSSEQHDIFNWF